MSLPPVPRTQSLVGVSPTQMDLHDWADRTVGIVQKFGFRQRLMDDDWRKWGMNMVQVLTRYKGGQVPRPDMFDTWQAWAEQINRTIGH